MKCMTLSFVTALLSMSLAGCIPPNSDYVEEESVPKRIVEPIDNSQSMEQQIAALKKQMIEDSMLPVLTVYKKRNCGCCKLWVRHMQQSGFKVSAISSDEMNPIKIKFGVPTGLGSCHTAKIGGYFVEGHVPASDVKRLLKEKPDALGISVPGMPMGSPGMEVPSGEVQKYSVKLVAKDGSFSTFSEHEK